MKTMMQAVVLGCIFVSPAFAFEARNGVDVNPVSANSFEVIEGGDFGPRSVWCAAGEYARSALGQRGNTRIYVEGPRADSRTVPGRKGVVFSLVQSFEAPSGPTILSQTIRTAGSSLPLHHAMGFCRDDRLLRSN